MSETIGDAGAAAQVARLSRLSEASLRISESLDLDTVLQVVLDAARTLTGARYGVITLVDDAGVVEDFLTSGLDAEEARQLGEMPDAMQFYEYLGGITGPLRVGDLSGRLRELGLPEMRSPVPVAAFLAAPVRHGSRSVGFIYLAREEGGADFGREDEETLVTFAAQAALVIANARRHREELRARADLETLLDTSPVGVVVFDAQQGVVKSINREARRIVGVLLDAEGSVGQVLSTLTFRRADGQVVSLEEFTLTQALSAGETVRAEEITIRSPDGRSVTTLVNATPIRSTEGGIDSYVVTIQDLTPLEETERLRAEFLGMVSHELRTPLTSILGAATTLLDNGAVLDPAEMRQFFRIILDQADHMRGLISDLLDVARIETGTLSVSPEPTDLATLVDQARGIFLKALGRDRLDLDLAPDLPQVMADRRRIVQVLGNLLTNAARYSPETFPIGVSAERRGLHVEVSVWDSGRGITAEQLPHLFRKYAPGEGGRRGQDPAGSGLGLAICKGIVEAHGGRIMAESGGPNLGAQFTFTLPTVEDATSGAVAAPSRSSQSGRGRTRVLAVDDDPLALRYIRDALSRAGYHPVVTADPENVPSLVAVERPHLVLLDLMLPGGGGLELMQSIQATTDVPVIFVSAYGQEENVIRALDMGAVDYVVKPFSASELAARIRAALRQRAGLGRAAQPPPYVLGDLSVNYAEREVTLSGHPVELTATEYAVLSELSSHDGMVLTHDQLLLRVWGVAHSGDAGLVRTIVRRLRQKLGDEAGSPYYILTEPRVGYRMRRGEARAQEEQIP